MHQDIEIVNEISASDSKGQGEEITFWRRSARASQFSLTSKMVAWNTLRNLLMNCVFIYGIKENFFCFCQDAKIT